MSIELIGEQSKNNNKRNANIFQEIDLISLDYSLRFSIKMHLIFAAMQFNVRDKNNCQSVKKKGKKKMPTTRNKGHTYALIYTPFKMFG